jgi:hypothetical protein
MSIYSESWYREQVAIAKRQNREHLRAYDRSFYGHLAKLAGRDDNEKGMDTIHTHGGGASDHHASKVADLLVEAGSHPDRSAALDHLMHSARGAALLSRMSKAADQPERETTMTTSRNELEQDIIKRYEQLAKSSGVVAVAKHVLVEGPSGLTKDDFNRMCNADWQRDRRSGESYDQCFERHYVAPENRDVRKADQTLTNFAPVFVGGFSAQNEAIDNTEQSEAYQQLVDKAEGLRASSPFLSTSQAFARASEQWPDLLAKAHKRPAPTTSYAFPR